MRDIIIIITDRFPDTEPADWNDIWDRSAAEIKIITSDGAIEFQRWNDEYVATLRTCDIVIYRSGAWRVDAPGQWSDGVLAEGVASSFEGAVRQALTHVYLPYELKAI